MGGVICYEREGDDIERGKWGKGGMGEISFIKGRAKVVGHGSRLGTWEFHSFCGTLSLSSILKHNNNHNSTTCDSPLSPLATFHSSLFLLKMSKHIRMTTFVESGI